MSQKRLNHSMIFAVYPELVDEINLKELGEEFVAKRSGRESVFGKALRALASSSGGAACPGATRGQPPGSTPEVRGRFQGYLREKKIFVTAGRRPDGRRMPDAGWTDRRTCWSK